MTHGQTRGRKQSRLYRIWSCMKTRVYNPNRPQYSDYGGKGISVCCEWRNSFEAFRDWAMRNGYRDDLTIDRIDNDKGYYPEIGGMQMNATMLNERKERHSNGLENW